jgi:hypothetical protein
VCTTSAAGQAECHPALSEAPQQQRLPEPPPAAPLDAGPAAKPIATVPPQPDVGTSAPGPGECPAERSPNWSEASAMEKRTMVRRCEAARAPQDR